MRPALLAVVLLLTACAPTVAHYRHPDAGTAVCERRPAQSDSQLGLIFQPIPILGLVGDLFDLGVWAEDRVRAGNAYADCKTDLEARGYVRVDE